MNIIAADVGGTKTHMVYADADKPDDFLYEARYSSKDFDSFEPLLGAFIRDSGIGKAALSVLSLALPGVIDNGVARLTNLPWTIDKQNLKKAFGIGRVHFMNDFQASALGTLQLAEHDCVVLNKGTHNPGAVRVVVGAGTGLGVSWIQGTGTGVEAHSTEGGHVDFAPMDDDQVKLLQFLVKRYGHVSCERLLSGEGLVNQYEFLSGSTVNGIDAAWINEQAGRDNEIAQRAMRMFVRIYGAFIGNLALMFKPEGGIYITGGIAAKMIDWMRSEDFINAYLYKGRMQRLVEQAAVFLVTNEKVGVMGAISEAVKLQQVEK